ncbi:hypothetical protein Taro_037864 [Colocasia esculenta]|uniref:Uncharacterized protein n=1 Tax=Colocasia esculenta TaxID=4460 RepID=A0A843WLY6_COLES|nr:hypothetical protein [Colocasia esculenta]
MAAIPIPCCFLACISRLSPLIPLGYKKLQARQAQEETLSSKLAGSKSRGEEEETWEIISQSGIICIIVDNLIKSQIYSDYVQAHLAPSGYIKIPTDMDVYLDKCRFLPKLNNERPNERNSTFKERFSSLQTLVLIMFGQDTVLVPRETSWFGYYDDGSFEPVLPPFETALYKEDWIGLKTLNEAGRVKFVNVTGNHLRISLADMRKHIVPYLEDKKSKSIMSSLSLLWAASMDAVRETWLGRLAGLQEISPLLLPSLSDR